ncbi:MAG: 50S ribosomal protein L17 [Candidatus Eisenbacteria bacterium]
MRHHRDHRALSRTAEHRRALMRNLVTSLFEHERIETTVAKAKEARRVAERMITYAKRDSIHSRRLVARTVQNEDVAKKLFDTITPWYATRQGGYTRVLKTRARLGDAGEMAILELVKTTEQKEAERRARAEKLAEAAKEREKKGKEREKEKGKEKGAEKATAEKGESRPGTREEARERREGGILGKLRRRREQAEEDRAQEEGASDKSGEAGEEKKPE